MLARGIRTPLIIPTILVPNKFPRRGRCGLTRSPARLILSSSILRLEQSGGDEHATACFRPPRSPSDFRTPEASYQFYNVEIESNGVCLKAPPALHRRRGLNSSTNHPTNIPTTTIATEITFQTIHSIVLQVARAPIYPLRQTRLSVRAKTLCI